MITSVDDDNAGDVRARCAITAVGGLLQRSMRDSADISHLLRAQLGPIFAADVEVTAQI